MTYARELSEIAAAITIDSSKNVGIGVTPSAWGLPAIETTYGLYSGRVELNNTTNAYFNGGWKYIATGVATQYRANGGQHLWSNAVSGTAGSAITWSESMRIDSSGNLLVGTTSLWAGTGKLTISKTGAEWARATNHTNAGTQYFDAFGYNGTIIGAIQGNNTSTSYLTTSDYRLKENIAPMTGALNTVAQLKPVTYNWKSDGSDGQGFIAHELQAVVPDAVVGEKDAVDADGNPKYQGIDTSFLVATLTAAIQEQQVMIEELKAKVAALEAA